MTGQQALTILSQAGSAFKGTLEEHQMIQQALALTKEAFEKAAKLDAKIEAVDSKAN